MRDPILNYIPETVAELELPSVLYVDQLMVRYRVFKGMSAKWTRARLGRYLRRVNPDWTDEQVKQAVAEIRGMTVRYDVRFTEAGAEYDVERVYRDGPNSCMSGGESAYLHRYIKVYEEFYAPVRVYAHPENNLRLAYAVVEGAIVARCWVNVKTKARNTVYASVDAYANARRVLEEHLLTLGYRYEPVECMRDELLLKVDTDCGAIVCPYIDPEGMGVSIEDDCLIIGADSYMANYETGCLQDFDMAVRTCESCSESVHDSDEYYTEDGYVCSECFDDHYVRASSCYGDVYIHADNAGTLLDGAGEVVGYVDLENLPHDVEQLTRGASAGYYSDDTVEDSDGDFWLRHEVEVAGYWPHSDGIWYVYPEEDEDAS